MISHKSFGSDNHAGAHEAVLGSLASANSGDAVAYGADPWTRRAADAIAELFGADGGVFFVFNGTAANVFGLSLMLRPYEGVICADTAHLNIDECGAPERVLGSKLLPVPTPDGKLTPELVGGRLGGRDDEHRVRPAAVAIAQASELGTCYTVGELRSLAAFCHDHGLRLYMDGARLANAAAHLDCSPADLAEHADVLSFGGTKNGAIGAEAVVVMSGELRSGAAYQRKQQLQLSSKMRFLAAQFLGLLEDQVWLRNAEQANAMARRLAQGVIGVPGVAVRQPVESNAVFAQLDPGHVAKLQQDWHFHVWDEREHVVRWMTAFDTSPDDVDAFLASIRVVAGGDPARS